MSFPTELTKLADAAFAPTLGGLWVEHSPLFDARLLTPAKLLELRRLYEPQAFALSRYFMMSLPSWISDRASRKNWKVSVLSRDHTPFAVSDPFASAEPAPDTPRDAT